MYFKYLIFTVTGAWKEPVPGWTVSKNSLQGFLMGAGKGVIRRLPIAKELIYDYIPVDLVVNNLITAAYAVNCNRYCKNFLFMSFKYYIYNSFLLQSKRIESVPLYVEYA